MVLKSQKIIKELADLVLMEVVQLEDKLFGPSQKLVTINKYMSG